MADYDLAVIGAGPGGYVAAIRAAQLGLSTVLIERDRVGGICANWGCIPSKALLRNAEVVSLFRRASEFGITYDNLHLDFGHAIERSRKVVEQLTKGVEFLLRKNKVTTVRGTAALRGGGRVAIRESGQEVQAKAIILATGARNRTLPVLPIGGRTVVSSREALELKDLPTSIAIIGGGATGCEFASVYAAYGVQVSIVELLPHLLPKEDTEISEAVERAFQQQGIHVMTGTRVTGARSEGKVTLSLQGASGAQELAVDRVLVAVGIQGNVEEMGLNEAGVTVEKGWVKVDEEMRTTAPNVYAIGDVTGRLPLAHVASAQGVAVVERLAGRTVPPLNERLMPRAVYCHPQVASWGLTESEARGAGLAVRTGVFPFSANGKALALGEGHGFVKVVVDERSGALLGAHLVGPEVTELLAELSMARMLEATTREVGWLVHAHPTLSEAIKEAALAATGEAIHL